MTSTLFMTPTLCLLAFMHFSGNKPVIGAILISHCTLTVFYQFWPRIFIQLVQPPRKHAFNNHIAHCMVEFQSHTFQNALLTLNTREKNQILTCFLQESPCIIPPIAHSQNYPHARVYMAISALLQSSECIALAKQIREIALPSLMRLPYN